jgi:hypothetical protein
LTLILDESSEILGVEDYIPSIETFAFYLITFAPTIIFDLSFFDDFLSIYLDPLLFILIELFE